MSDDLNSSILDCLIPGNDSGWPAAGQHGLTLRFLQLLEMLSNEGLQQLATVTENLPKNFYTLSRDSQTTYLSTVEKEQPAAFQAVLKAAYSAYYTDQTVRQILETETGYEARPPQPHGYELQSFDEELLEPVREKGPMWREVP
jgi:hypothetical protein